MSVDTHAVIEIEDIKDNYDTLFVKTFEPSGVGHRRWGLPATGGWSAADTAPIGATDG